MHRKLFLNLCCAAFAAFATVPASAQTTLAGIKLDPEVTVAGQKLQLNGAGVRMRAVFKVYVAGFYTAGKMPKNEDVLTSKTPKRLVIVALRDVKSSDLGKLFTKGIEENVSKAEMSKLIFPLVKMGEVFSEGKDFAKGEVITMDFLPTGLQITFRGKLQGDIKEPDFAPAMLKIWFGGKPADEALRKALLGEQSTANTNMN